MRPHPFPAYKIFTILAFLFAVAVIVAVQFSIPTLYGADGYLHIRMAELIKGAGPIRDFHWARLSVFSRYFADKDFLYHVLLVPFTCGSNIFWGAKLSACFFAVLFLFVFFMFQRRYSDRALAPFLLLAVLLSGRFLHVLSRPRPMIFVITLTLLALYFLIEKKLWGLFFVTVVYCLSHVSGPYMLVYAFITETVRWISKRQFYFKSVGVAALGVLVSYLVHPNFPNNFLIFYLNAIVVPIYAVKWGLELGAEFFPLSTREFLLSYPLIVLGILALLATAVFARPKTKFATRVIFVHSALFLFFSFLSRRYAIHGYPLILLFFAAYLSDYFQNRPWTQLIRKNKVLAAVSIVGLCMVFLFSGAQTYSSLRSQASSGKVANIHFENVGKWMQRNIPEGELVFHANWSDSQYLIGLNPKNDYFVTLDPIYMFWWKPKLYSLYREVAFGRTKDPYPFLKDTFKIRYGYAGKNFFGGLINQIRQDPRFKILAEDNQGIIFKLKEGG